MHIRRRCWSRCKFREGRGIQPGNLCHVVEVDELRQVAILHAVLGADVLMLMMEILAKFSEAHGGESLLVKGGVIAAAQIPIQPEHEHRFYTGIVSTSHARDIASELSRAGIVLAAQAANPTNILLLCGQRQTLGKD